MAVEIEVKMRAHDVADLRERLRRAGATFARNTAETNRFFDTPQGELRLADRGLRLRTNQDLDSKRQEHIVTLKGPRQPGKHKAREESEFGVTDVKTAAHVFEQLGFPQRLVFEKRRESWTLRDCKIELDELPELGTFIEIEGPGEASIDQVRQTLGLANEPAVKESYASMIGDLLARRGATELRFTQVP